MCTVLVKHICFHMQKHSCTPADLYQVHTHTHTCKHTLYINQTKSLSTTQWCHRTAIIHPRGYSGQHRSVSHSPSIHGVPPPHPASPARLRLFQPTAEPIRGDGSSWIMHTLTQVLIWKWIPDQYWPVYSKQKNEQHSRWSEVSVIITLYCESERGGGLRWPSSLNAAP